MCVCVCIGPIRVIFLTRIMTCKMHFSSFSSFQELNLPVVGSEIVGLVPLQSVLLAAEYYIQKDNLFVLEEKHKIRLVRVCVFVSVFVCVCLSVCVFHVCYCLHVCLGN